MLPKTPVFFLHRLYWCCAAGVQKDAVTDSQLKTVAVAVQAGISKIRLSVKHTRVLNFIHGVFPFFVVAFKPGRNTSNTESVEFAGKKQHIFILNAE